MLCIGVVHFSPALQQTLREDATAVCKQYGLSTTELQAVQSGDARQLVDLGMDPRLVHDATPALTDKAHLFLLRMSVVVMAGAMALFALAPGAHASARTVPRLGKRADRRVSARRVLRSVRARISERAQVRHARYALSNVRARMKTRDGSESDVQLQSNTGLSYQDPIQ